MLWFEITIFKVKINWLDWVLVQQCNNETGETISALTVHLARWLLVCGKNTKLLTEH